MKLNPEMKQKWLKALRSGDYHQVDGSLRKGNSFCCLGVLCDISDRGKWDGQFYDMPNGESTILLPEALYEELGLNDGAVEVPFKARNYTREDDTIVPDTKITLAELNDAGLTFPQIADVIEYFL